MADCTTSADLRGELCRRRWTEIQACWQRNRPCTLLMTQSASVSPAVDQHGTDSPPPCPTLSPLSITITRVHFTVSQIRYIFFISDSIPHNSGRVRGEAHSLKKYRRQNDHLANASPPPPRACRVHTDGTVRWGSPPVWPCSRRVSETSRRHSGGC